MTGVMQPVPGHGGVGETHGVCSEGTGIATCSLPVRCNTLLQKEQITEANIETGWFRLAFPDANFGVVVKKTLGSKKPGNVHLRLQHFGTDFAILPRGIREYSGLKASPFPGCCLDSAERVPGHRAVAPQHCLSQLCPKCAMQQDRATYATDWIPGAAGKQRWSALASQQSPWCQFFSGFPLLGGEKRLRKNFLSLSGAPCRCSQLLSIGHH